MKKIEDTINKLKNIINNKIIHNNLTYTKQHNNEVQFQNIIHFLEDNPDGVKYLK